eukprot:gene17816-793_t
MTTPIKRLGGSNPLISRSTKARRKSHLDPELTVPMLEASRQTARDIWCNQVRHSSQKEIFQKLRRFQEFVIARQELDPTPRTIGEDLMNWAGYLHTKGTIQPRVIANYLEHVKSGIRLSTGTPVMDLMLPAFARSLKKDARNRPIKRAYAILKLEVDHLVDGLVAEGLPHVAAFAALAWTTAGRLSDIVRLRPGDICPDEDTRNIRVSWFQVKDDPQQVKPDWVGSLGRWTHLVLDQIGRSSAAKLFPGAASLYLKEVQARVPKATGHSFERGAVQHLAPEMNLEQLMYMPLGPYPEELDEDDELPLVSQVVEGSEYGEHEDVDMLIMNDIIRERKPREQILAEIPAFKVPKKDASTSRLILDGRFLSSVTAPPPDFKLPTPEMILERAFPKNNLVEAFWAMDLKNCFYQIPIGEKNSGLLAVRLLHKGRPKSFLFTRLPMGLSVSPYIAQKINKTVAHAAGPGVDVYLDNFFDFGDLVEAVKSFNKQRSLFSDFHMEIKEAETQPVSDKWEVLGMEFDLSKRIHRLAPAWHQKFRTLMRDFSWEQRMTLRDLWSHAHSMFWGLRVLQVPLCRLFRLLQQLRGFAKELQQEKKDWDTQIRLKPASIKEAVGGTQLVQSNQWVHHPLVGSRLSVQVWSDASNIGWGAIVDGRAFAGRWTVRQAQEHINVREAWAAKYALQLALKLFPPHEALVYHCLIDNDTLVKAMKNGRCKNFLINAVVDWFWAASWGWEASWVSTKDQLADYPSRNPDAFKSCL